MYDKENNPFLNEFTDPSPDMTETEETTMREEISPNDLLFVGNNDLYDKDHNNYNFYALGAQNKEQDGKIETLENNIALLGGNRVSNDLGNRSELVWYSSTDSNGDFGIYGFNRSIYGNGTNQNITFRRNGYWSNGIWTGGTPISFTESDTELVLRWLPYNKDDAAGAKTQKHGNIFTTVPVAAYFNYHDFGDGTEPQGMGVPMPLIATNFSRVAVKYVYINPEGISFPSGQIGDTSTTAYNYNYSSATTAAGIKYDNSRYVLVEVYIVH